MRVLWMPSAEADLDQIELYIVADNAAAAAGVAERILEATAVLESFPAAGRAGRVEGTRELVVTGTPHIIAYAAQRGEVVILAVVHGSRAWPEAFETQ